LFRHARGSAEVLTCSTRYPFVASAGQDGTIAWQTLTTPSQTRLLQHLKREPLAIWLPTEDVGAMAVNRETLLKFSLRDATVLSEQPLGIRSGRAACFSPDGKQCVLVESRDIYWTSCQESVLATKIHSEERDSFTSVVFHPNNRWIAVAGRGNVLIYDVVDREPLARIAFGTASTVKCLQFSPDGSKIAISNQSSDTDIHIYEFESL
jgi:WD40 repeat protein